MSPQFEWAWYFWLRILSLSFSLSLRVPKLLYPSICQPSIFPSVLLSSIALCCTYPDFLHQSLSTSVSPSFPVLLAFSWLNVARNKFLKAGESAPLGLSCTFHFLERKFWRETKNRAKKKQSERERTMQYAKSSKNQVQGQSPSLSARWASKPFRLPNSWIID